MTFYSNSKCYESSIKDSLTIVKHGKVVLKNVISTFFHFIRAVIKFIYSFPIIIFTLIVNKGLVSSAISPFFNES